MELAHVHVLKAVTPNAVHAEILLNIDQAVGQFPAGFGNKEVVDDQRRIPVGNSTIR